MAESEWRYPTEEPIRLQLSLQLHPEGVGIRIWEVIRSPMTACWGQEYECEMISKQSLMGLLPSVFPGHRASYQDSKNL